MTTAYLIRHAQSYPSSKLPEHKWPLSELGKNQAEALSELLEPLGIKKLHSSPYQRCLSTISPFAERSGVEMVENHDLRERRIGPSVINDFKEVWRRSWQDFSFALPGCENSFQAQRRFVRAVRQVLQEETGIIGISTHGNVLALLLNHLDSTYGREDADKLSNPDVVKVDLLDDNLKMRWDPDFRLPGIQGIATHHDETPIDW